MKNRILHYYFKFRHELYGEFQLIAPSGESLEMRHMHRDEAETRNAWFRKNDAEIEAAGINPEAMLPPPGARWVYKDVVDSWNLPGRKL
jgi:hypothetical protein